ncbi:MAG TPA: hypothetical protein VNM14_21390 [Planctomycetota bacterium]|nr:hypothetical protein [Planctomycetota bacterium]
MGVLLDFMELRSDRLQWGLIFGLLGIALSFASLLVALVGGPCYPSGTVQSLGALLIPPYILIQPVCYIEGLGYGLGGDTVRAGYYGYLSLASLILIPVTFLGLLFASRRSRGTK